jgi:catechol 2,3-dioxygenase-like lactoylglutathione lyase family enzyme
MSETGPLLDQLNLVVRDMDASLAFYRRLGIEIRDGPGDWPPGSGARHANASMTNGMRLELDNPAMARIWHGGFAERSAATAPAVLGFSLPTREAVDRLYASLTAAGAPARQEPYDGFWGARYAIVQDPDGNDVGLMSPIDPERRYTPEV